MSRAPGRHVLVTGAAGAIGSAIARAFARRVYPGPVRSSLERRARSQAPATLLARYLPTGDAEPLAERIVDASIRRRPRVVYPAFYELANRFPRIAGRVTGAASPVPHDTA